MDCVFEKGDNIMEKTINGFDASEFIGYALVGFTRIILFRNKKEKDFILKSMANTTAIAIHWTRALPSATRGHINSRKSTPAI